MYNVANSTVKMFCSSRHRTTRVGGRKILTFLWMRQSASCWLILTGLNLEPDILRCCSIKNPQHTDSCAIKPFSVEPFAQTFIPSFSKKCVIKH